HVGVEAVDRLDQAQEADLDDVLQRLAAVLEAPRKEVHEALVPANKLLTDLGPLTPIVGLGVAAGPARARPAACGGGTARRLRLRLAQVTRYFTIRYLI